MDALAAPDGTSVTLRAVLVSRVSADAVYVEVRDAWDGHFRLAVVPGERVAVHPSQTVDVSGVMGTLASGRRVVIGAVLEVYRDSRGEVVLPPVAPGMAEDGTLWRSPAPVSGVGGALAGLSLRRLEEEPEVPADGEGEPPVGSPPAVGTIAWAKTRPDGTLLSEQSGTALLAKVVTVVLPDCYYIQEPWPGGPGIRVAEAPTQDITEGRLVSITAGQIGTGADGERQIVPLSGGVSLGPVGPRPAGVLMAGRVFYCGPLAATSDSGPIQDAVGPDGGEGAHHIGTLARAIGEVTHVETDALYVWDGSKTPSGLPMQDGVATGLRVQFPAGYLSEMSLEEGDFVRLTGVSGLRLVDNVLYPVLRVRECEKDLSVVWPVFDPCSVETAVEVTYEMCGKAMASTPVVVLGSGVEILQADESWEPVWIGQLGADGRATLWVRPVEGEATGWLLVSAGETGHSTALYQEFPVGAGVPVTLVADSGGFGNPPGVSTYATQTGLDGMVTVQWTPSSCPGSATITATASAAPCNTPFSATRQVRVYCENPAYIDVFFCIDVTGSMNNQAIQPLVNLVEAIDAKGIPVRYGGLKFGDHLVSVTPAMTEDAEIYKYWLLDGTATGGGDAPENQLLALYEASVRAPGAFVLLATDDEFHYAGDNSNPRTGHYPGPCSVTNLTDSEVRSALANGNCKIFVDCGVSQWVSVYLPIVVYGTIEEDLGTYTFPLFRAAIGLD